MRLPAVLLAFAAIAALLLGGCQTVGRQWSSPAEASRKVSDPWYADEKCARMQGTMLVKSTFARVPMAAMLSKEASGRLVFVGVSDWGMRLAEADVTLEDTPPARLNPMLTRIPGLAARLSRALARMFLAWPSVDAAGQDESLSFTVDPRDGLVTAKRGTGPGGAWTASLSYRPQAGPSGMPERIEYRGEGLDLTFTFKELCADE